MRGRRLSALTLAALVLLVLAAAAGASTFAVSASPQNAGTKAAPRPVSLSLTLSDIGYVNGKPSRTLVSATEQLDPGFNDRLALFPTCPTSDFASVNSSPPPCPSGSQVGTIAFKAFVPSLGLTATAAGYIYSVSADAVEAWVLAQIPGYKLGVAVPGKLTGASTSAGPSVAWNLGAAVNFGVTADITQLNTTWDIHTIAVTTTAERTAVFLHGRGHKPGTRTSTTTSQQPESVFESSACPAAGAWSFGASLTYKTGSPEAVSATAACSASSAPVAPTPPASSTTITTPAPPSCIKVLTICLRRSRSAHLRAGAAR